MRTLTLGWLYPELMSTYGDRGNISVLKKLAEINGFNLNVRRINQESSHTELIDCDLLFMGGAQDIQQEIVNKDLLSKKGDAITKLINEGVPSLFICGAYQFLGNYYKNAYGTKIPGLGIFDMYTEAFENRDRLIGNVIVQPKKIDGLTSNTPYLVGFENHGGRTYLSNPLESFASIVVGNGNNGEDKTEGIHFNNAIGTYLHGPILPSNPELAAYLLSISFEKKTGEKKHMKTLNEYAKKARAQILERLKASY